MSVNIPVNSLEKYVHEVSKISGRIYRGHSNRAYVLTPTIGRDNARKDGDGNKVGVSQYDLKAEQKSLEKFKREAIGLLDVRNQAPSTDLEWMALAQHHGHFTRLLDWSESPLISLFFAVCNAGINGDAEVLSVARPEEITSEQSLKIWTDSAIYFYRSPIISDRIKAQHGVFTVHGKPTDKWEPAEIIRYQIPKLKCGEIKVQLFQCGIDEAVIKPGLDGLAERVKWLYKWPSLATLIS